MAETLVAMSVDVDGEAPLLGSDPQAGNRLARMSEWRYGITTGLPRLEDTFRQLGIVVTFFVPGYIADTYPDSVKSLADSDHQIGHHGYLHKNAELLPEAEQREEMERGIEAIERCFGLLPTTYRAPFCGFTPTTEELLDRHGFTHDSSLMDGDTAHFVRMGTRDMIEVLVHWSLDDGVYYAFEDGAGMNLQPPSAWRQTLIESFDAAVETGTMLSVMTHPHWSGRPAQSAQFRAGLEYMLDNGARFLRHMDIQP